MKDTENAKEHTSMGVNSSQRLLSPLPESNFVDRPEEIDRFIVRIWPDGTLYFKGNRTRIDEFLSRCAEAGLDVQVDHISLCG
jgi:hypothetical protein